MAVDGRDESRRAGEARVPEQGSAGRGDADAAPAELSAGRPSGRPRPARDHVPQQRERPAGVEPPLSDTELVARVRGGDDSAYEELYRRHAASVRRYARTCCRDAHTAEDLTGEVFARTLQAVRGGSGPESAVRAYLLTTVRRVAAAWGNTAKREQLVEDFAVFATSAAGAGAGEETTAAGADVRAMHEADQSLAVRAFKTLPERWQAVLWHTAVEDESPSQVAPLLGLTANATAVLAHRAREGLRQAYLQAHVNAALTSEGECARYADRLGAYARGGLRLRADRELRKHLADCAKCRAAAADLADVNACLKSALPVATIGWFAAAYVAKVAGFAAGAAAVGAVGGGAAAGTSESSGAGAAGAVASEGLGLPAKAAIAAGVVLAGAGVAVAATLLAGHHHPATTTAKPPAAPPPVASVPTPPSPAPTRAPAPTPAPASTPVRQAAVARHTAATPEPVPKRPGPPRPAPSGPAPAAHVYEINALPISGFDTEPGEPFVRLSLIDWFWQRHGLTLDGASYANGVTVHAPSTLTVDLNRACRAYDATVGLDRLSFGAGAVRFQVYGDNIPLYTSPVLTADSDPVRVHADLTGRASLRLVVRRAGDGSLLALADWADSRVTCG